jgi:hypothetical protein
MTSSPIYKCWEMMKCKNHDCPARSEPETPCWEIAKRIDSRLCVTRTCHDCVVYLLKGETTTLSRKRLQSYIKNRNLMVKFKASKQACILENDSND